MKKQYHYLIISILLFVLFSGIAVKKHLVNTIGYNMCSKEEMERIEEQMVVTERTNIGELLFQGTPIPFCENTEAYYLPLNTQANWRWEYKFSSSNPSVKIYWCEDPYWNDMEKAIECSHEFSFYVIEDSQGMKGKIIFTGLPMLKMEEVEELDTESGFGTFTLFDPFELGNQNYQIIENYVIYERRGSTSRIFPKKAYNLILCDENKKPIQKSILGMRYDDEWKLNSLYSDSSKIREQICMNLWNEIAGMTSEPYDAGTKMEYLEIVMNERYRGLYGLMEPIDYKQLSLNKSEDILYKATAWPDRGNQEISGLEGEIEEYCGLTVKNAGRKADINMWNPAIEYIEMTGLKKASQLNNQSIEYIEHYMNVKNCITIDLFVQAIRATDNLYKNQYLAAIIKQDEEYELWRVPWDMNFSLGDRFTEEERDLTWFDLQSSTDVLKDHLIVEKLLNLKNIEITKMINDYWKELRSDILSPENIECIAYKYYDVLNRSGAYRRDSIRWYDECRDLENEIKDIFLWYCSRVAYLDDYYNNYTNF